MKKQKAVIPSYINNIKSNILSLQQVVTIELVGLSPHRAKNK